MCTPDYRALKTAQESFMREQARLKAKRRAEVAAKCDVLQAIDRAIANAKLGDTIYDVLMAARIPVLELNAGAEDTIRKLLTLEGFK
jgi:hypothetical protein